VSFSSGRHPMPPRQRIQPRQPRGARPFRTGRRQRCRVDRWSRPWWPRSRLPPAAASLPAPSAAESAELLALGAELDIRIEAYRAAAARLAEVRAVAARLWPAVPAELVVGFDRADRDLYADCYARETDFEGNRSGRSRT
jgi:hypothetical protein